VRRKQVIRDLLDTGGTHEENDLFCCKGLVVGCDLLHAGGEQEEERRFSVWAKFGRSLKVSARHNSRKNPWGSRGLMSNAANCRLSSCVPSACTRSLDPPTVGRGSQKSVRAAAIICAVSQTPATIPASFSGWYRSKGVDRLMDATTGLLS
jgi:hypothetical protein